MSTSTMGVGGSSTAFVGWRQPSIHHSLPHGRTSATRNEACGTECVGSRGRDAKSGSAGFGYYAPLAAVGIAAGMGMQQRQRRVVRTALPSPSSVSTGRREVLREGGTAVLAVAVAMTNAPTKARAEEVKKDEKSGLPLFVVPEEEKFKNLGNEELNAELPPSYVWSEKPIYIFTHIFEQRVSAQEPFDKWIIGVTVDEVGAKSLAEVGTAAEIGENIITIERDKEGTKKAEMISCTLEPDVNGTPTYVFDFTTETSRGNNRTLSRVALRDGKLYSYTSQAPIEQWGQLESVVRASASTFNLIIPKAA